MGVHANINSFLSRNKINNLEGPDYQNSKIVCIIDVLTLLYTIPELCLARTQVKPLYAARFISEYILKTRFISKCSAIYLTTEGTGCRKKLRASNIQKSRRQISISASTARHNIAVCELVRDFLYSSTTLCSKCQVYVVAATTEADVQIASIVEIYGLGISHAKVTSVELKALRNNPTPCATAKEKVTLILWTIDSDVLITAAGLKFSHINLIWYRSSKFYTLQNVSWQFAIFLMLFGCDRIERLMPDRMYSDLETFEKYRHQYRSDAPKHDAKDIIIDRIALLAELAKWQIDQKHVTRIICAFRYYTRGNILQIY